MSPTPSRSFFVQWVKNRWLFIFVILQISEVVPQPLECLSFENEPCVNVNSTDQFVACQPDLSDITGETCMDEVRHEFS